MINLILNFESLFEANLKNLDLRRNNLLETTIDLASEKFSRYFDILNPLGEYHGNIFLAKSKGTGEPFVVKVIKQEDKINNR